jgi:hypothetical protein
MAWYRTGTVTVTNGSATVTGTGTDFVSNASAGEAFLGADGRTYEIAQVISATQLQLAGVYQGATAGGQGYAVLPTQSFTRDLALLAAELLNSFATVRDGIGQGLVPDGNLAAPGIRFAADQDTGLTRVGANQFSLVAGGAASVTVGPGQTQMRDIVEIAGLAPAVYFGSDVGAWGMGLPAGTNAFTVWERQFGIEKMRVDAAGNLLLGVTSGLSHVVTRGNASGQQVIQFSAAGQTSTAACRVFLGDNYPVAAAGACLKVDASASTGRSVAAAGTLNANGADYAEYMTKADGCGTIAPGDVCGVDQDGKLTRTWADALSFVVKSTDPAYVGGDTWASHLPPRPEGPGSEPAAPVAPEALNTDDPAAVAAWQARSQAYLAARATYDADHAAWVTANAAHEAEVATWEAELEAARQCVDRIAFSGQVPVNVAGDFAVGDYLVAAANGGGIRAIAVPEADITFEQYRRRVGKIWAIRDGRPWVDVQHG